MHTLSPAKAQGPATPNHPADRLSDAIDRLRAPVCVGLDPVVERLPAVLRPSRDGDTAALTSIERFCEAVLNATMHQVAIVKLQSACFERYGSAGVAALERTAATAKRLGFQVILDAKRGDIGVSAEHYAHAARSTGSDWVTINAYVGEDGIVPFLCAGMGAFALVRTSNPGGDAIQSPLLSDGRRVCEAVASEVARIGGAHMGAHGLSALGAVVGATKAADAARLRTLMPQQVFLVPGYGTQGGSLVDALACFKEPDHGVRRGAIVTASRSIIYAFEKESSDWEREVAQAARVMADEIGAAVGMR